MPDDTRPVDDGMRMAATILRAATGMENDCAYALMTAEIIAAVVVLSLSNAVPPREQGAAARDLTRMLTRRLEDRVNAVFPPVAAVLH